MPLDIDDARSRLAGLEQADPSRVHRDIAALAHPRMTGSEGAAAVESRLRRQFEELGFRCQDLPFSFSTLPGRFGISVAGVALTAGGVAGAGLLMAGFPGAALAVLALSLALAAAPILLLETASERLPWRRVHTANLLFAPVEGPVSWIVLAHRDTKAQLVPTLVRTVALGLAATAWLALVVVAALWTAGAGYELPTLAGIAGAVLTGTGLLLALSWATDGSPGALDNATGLAALLAVAEMVGPRARVGFLLTDGEELGLAGARAVVNRLPPVQGVINVDGLDDDGTIHLAEGHGWARRGSAPQLAAALLSAGAVLDLPVRRRRLPRTLLVDHLPIAAAGIPALTVLRGGWSSLLRVHGTVDTASRLNGRGAAQVATLLAGALTLLREGEAPHLARRRAVGS